MNKLALSHEILMTIEKPARYIGNEVNMVVKQPEEVDIRFAILAFRYCMKCLTDERIPIVNGYTLRGRIYIIS